tara:strand:- start:81 stop:524 length:444 start_codon:yes stop_codon:yes gene_type:complete
MKTSKAFNESYNKTLEEYRELQNALDKKYDVLIHKLALAEAELQEAKTVPDHFVGDRVWCKRHKRQGTVVEAKCQVNVSNDDYYQDRVGPGRYYDADDGDPDPDPVQWTYTIQPDPSPVQGRPAQTYITSKPTLLDENGEPISDEWC